MAIGQRAHPFHKPGLQANYARILFRLGSLSNVLMSFQLNPRDEMLGP
jgi:hypothetical protein